MEKHKKRTIEVTPKNKKKVFIKHLQRIFIYVQSSVSCSFLQTCINFVEERLKISQFEGSIIPSCKISILFTKTLQNFGPLKF